MAQHAARTLLVFGANTNVGKTVISGGLMLAALRCGSRAQFLKPMQTGPPEDHDEEAVARVCKGRSGRWGCTTLYSWPEPLSPHLAAERAGSVVADSELLDRTTNALRELHSESSSPAAVVLETAGGVLSPSAEGTPQCEVYAPLSRLENTSSLLVGDAVLGGISTTLAALEALESRGFKVGAVVMQRGDNADYLERWLGERVVVERFRELPETGPLDLWHTDKHNAAVFERLVERAAACG